jgi:ABC-type transporter Mla MlaB component
MVSLDTVVAPDLANGYITVTVSGYLTMRTAPALRTVLQKCVTQSPDAVIVNLEQLRVDAPPRLTLFAAAVRTQSSPAVALILYGASDQLRAMMTEGILSGVAVYDTRQQALAAVTRSQVGAPRRTSLRLGATTAAPAAARAMVSFSCHNWGIDHLIGPATLVISELVSNAVQHAGTDIHVAASLRGHYLHLSVRDGNPGLPVLIILDNSDTEPLSDRGRGLYLVDVYATAWGSTSTPDGKTVWATLRAKPVSEQDR